MINQNTDNGFFYAVMMLYPICHNQVVKLVPWLVLKIEHLASSMNYQSQHMSVLHDRTTGVKFIMCAYYMLVFNIHLHYPLKERLLNINYQMPWIIWIWVRVIYVFKIYINKFVFEKNLLKIKKVVKIFSIFNNFFYKYIIMCL